MQKAARVGDIIAGHDFCAPVTIATGSPTVFVGGRPAARVGDVGTAHGCDNVDYMHPLHQPTITTGSNKVFINGRPAARLGDQATCLDGIICTITTGDGSVVWA